MGPEFEAVASNFVEKLDDRRPPEDVAKELALGKALDVAKYYPDSLVIGADTIVTIDGIQLAKPHDAQEAIQMLKQLSGRRHEVSTGLAVVRLSDNTEVTAVDTAEVYFKPYDEAAVKAYVATGDPMDKAVYGIQSGAAPLVSHIVGNYDTIIGLPTSTLAEILQGLGIECQPAQLLAPVEQR